MSDDDDPRLEALAARIRARDGLADPRWDALAEGSLSDEEQAELRDRPPRPGSIEAPYDVFRPLDAEERGSLADGVFAALDARAAAKDRAEVIAAPNARPALAATRPAILPARRSRLIYLLAAALCVAIGAGVVLLPRRPAPAPIAAYSLSLVGGNKAHLADPSAREDVVRLDPASRIELTLRPASPIEGAIAVRSFAVQGESARPWDAPALAGKGGVIHVEGTAAALLGDLPAGAWELVIVVGRPESMPPDEELRRLAPSAKSAASPGIQILRARVILEGDRGTTGSIEGERRIEPAGCGAVLAGPICELAPDRAVRFWVRARSGASLRVSSGGARIEPESQTTPAAGGVRLAVKAPIGAVELSVTVTEDGAEETLRLPLAEAPAMPAVRDAEARMRKGDLDAAEKQLAAAEEGASPLERLEIQRIRARVELARGRADRAITLLGEAAGRDREAGRVSAEFEDRTALAYALTYQGRRFAEARAAVAALAPLFDAFPEGRAKAPYYLGLIAFETGDLRAALRLFHAAAEGAERLGFDEYRSAVLEPWAAALAVLGRSAEAMDRLREAQSLVAANGSPCRRAQFANNLGWTMLRAEGAASGPDRAATHLEEALALARGACPAGLGDILTNLALAELDRDRYDAARRYLDEARRVQTSPDPRLDVWWRILEGRLALREGRAAAALAAAEKLAAAGEDALLPEMSFEGALGRAQALDALGRSSDARAAYAAADHRLDAWAQTVPLGEGRDTFLAQHRRSTSLRVDFLLREAARAPGEPAAGDLAREALIAARRGLARIVSSLRWNDRVSELSPEARARWDEALAAYKRERAVLEEKAAGDASRAGAARSIRDAERARLRAALDQALAQLGAAPASFVDDAALAEPAAGEALLVYHPIRDGWAGFALAASTPTKAGAITWRKLGAIDPTAPKERLAALLLEPFRDAMNGAARLRFTAYGPLNNVDFHALPWDGRPLFERAPVAYGLDLPGRADPDPPLHAQPVPPGGSSSRPVAVVIADPTEDLPGARRSAGRVAALLERRGMRVVRLDGRDAAHEAVRDAIERAGATLLHYTGHAVFEGLDGWEAGLRLARNGRLTVPDIMALSRVPPFVVLAGCDTGRAAPIGDPGSGLGLAQAFLARGARSVLATTRPLGDALAERASERFYERDPAGAGAAFDLAAALQGAQRDLAQADPGADWAVFRVFVP